MAVRRRRKGKPTVNIISFDEETLKEVELHMRDADRRERSQGRFLQRHQQARATSPNLSATVSSAVQEMRIEDG